jgi:hypothetical protein
MNHQNTPLIGQAGTIIPLWLHLWDIEVISKELMYLSSLPLSAKAFRSLILSHKIQVGGLFPRIRMLILSKPLLQSNMANLVKPSCLHPLTLIIHHAHIHSRDRIKTKFLLD